MFPKSLLIVAVLVCAVSCESKITVSVTNDTQVDLETYLADINVAAASTQYSANLTTRLVNMLQEFLVQKKVKCDCSDTNIKPNREKGFDLPGHENLVDNTGKFFLYTEQLTWNEARKFCKREKSKLAVPMSHAEFDTLFQMLMQDSKKPIAFLGLHHLYGKDDWLSVSGEPAPQWIYSLQDNMIAKRQILSFTNVPDGNCTALNGNRQLMSVNCDTPLAYFCESR